MATNQIIDNKGHLTGRVVDGKMLDSKGHLVARYIEGSNRTVDTKGKNVGVGDQRLVELGKRTR